MIFWLIFIIFNLQNCYMIAVMTMCLKKRFPNASVWKYILAFEAGSIIASYFRFTLPFYSTEYSIVYNWMTFFLVVFIAAGFKDYVWKKMLWLISYLCVASLSEVLCSYILSDIFDIQLQGTWDCSDDLIYMITTNLVLFVVTIIPIMLWKRALISISGRGRVILPLIMMPVSQIFMFEYLLNNETRFSMSFSEEVYWVFALFFIADAVFLLILIRQEEVSQIKIKIKALEHAWELERVYYEGLEEKERAISKARHDIKNQITVMYHLLEAGNVDEAKKMQQELMKQV